MIDIVKLANGNVAIYDSTSGDFINSLSPDIVEIECNVNGSVKVVQDNGSVEYIDPATVQNTEVVPAAAIPFTGDCADLAQLLSTDFFFVVSGGGGSQDLASVLGFGNSAGAFNIDLNNNDLLNTDKIDFNLATTDTAGIGQLVWNDTLGTLNLGLKGGNTISNVGQHLHARVVNKTTPLVALTKAGYEVVIVAGATGQRLSVKLARADNDTNSAGTLGIVCENIAGNQEGFICSVGQVTNINTTGSLQGETWADGDSLYLSGTTFGAITNVKPSAPIHEVRIGYVEYAHAVNGKIYVKIDNGYEISELHDVAINTGTLANNDVLTYESSTQLWKNKPFTNAEGWSVIVKSANQDVTNNATLQDDTELQFSVVAGGQYMTELNLCYAGNNITADMKLAYTLSTGTMKASGIVVGFSLGSSPANNQSISVNGTISAPASIGVIQADLDNLHTATITFNFTASSNAILKFQFANNSAAVGAISRIVKGSILKYKKIN
jgi:hypothetical protein